MRAIHGCFFFLFLSNIPFASAAVDSSQDPAKAPASVTVQTLHRGEEFDTLLFPARTYSRVQTNLYAEGEGIVRSLPANVGQKVSKQEALMVIQNTDPVYQYAPIRVKSPVSGVVSALEVKQGAHVMKGMLLASVTDPSKLRITIEVPAQDLALVVAGRTGEFKSSSLPHPVKVKVLGVSPLVDSKTGTATADLELTESALIPTGAVGQVSLKTNIHSAMVIGEDALIYRDGKPTLRTIVDGKIKLLGVELGASRRGKVEIKTSIPDGQTAVLRASRFVTDGEKVIIESEKKPAEKSST